MSDSPHAPRVFILMPFGQKGETDFDKVYEHAIKPACQSVGAVPIRAEAYDFSGKVLKNIHNSIAKADVVIADLTGLNPNVLYELGYAVSLYKPVVRLAKEGTDIPRDISEHRVILYYDDVDRLRDDLASSLGPEARRPRKGGEVTQVPKDGAGVRPGYVFISYSHLDKVWLERLRTMYKPLAWGNNTSTWDDTLIPPGDMWEMAIDQAIAAAKVAVLLVSPTFLASDFIREKELPRILDAARQKRLVLLWVLLADSFYDAIGLEPYQAAHNIKRPLESLTRPKRNTALREICEKISKALGPDLARGG